MMKTMLVLREAFIVSFLTIGLLISFSCEMLSLFHFLTRPGLLTFWTIILFVVVILFIKNRPFQIIKINILRLPAFEIFLSVWMTVTITILGVIAVVAPPNTWDSLAYHLPRVMHWIQNHTIAHYPTTIVRQLYHPPFAEWAILHLHILSGSDRWANLIQWFSMLGTLCAISLIAKELGASRRGQLITTALALSIPTGILQASSTQNDYAAALWLSILVYFTLKLLREMKGWRIGAYAISLGLLLLTKGTGYIFAVPFVGWLLFSAGPRNPIKCLKYFSIIFAFVLLMNAGHLIRNMQTFGHPLGGPTLTRLVANENFSLPLFFSNIVLNVAQQLTTPFPALNRILEEAIHPIHEDFRIAPNPFHEDNNGNVLHTLLILMTFVWFLIHFKNMPVDLKEFFIVLIAGFLIFNVFLKWQPFNNRLFLPLMILWAPCIAIMLNALFKSKTSSMITVLILLCSLPWLVGNESRPLISQKNIFKTPRLEQYFANNPGFQYSFTGAVKEITSANCTQIGLYMGEDSWEYPWWVLLEDSSKKIRIEQVDVRNDSKDHPYPLGNFVPCAIVDDDETGKDKMIEYNNQKYIKTRRFAFTNVYLRLDLIMQKERL